MGRPTTIVCCECRAAVQVQEKGKVPLRCKPCALKSRSAGSNNYHRALRIAAKDKAGDILVAVGRLVTAHDSGDWQKASLEVESVVRAFKAAVPTATRGRFGE